MRTVVQIINLKRNHFKISNNKVVSELFIHRHTSFYCTLLNGSAEAFFFFFLNKLEVCGRSVWKKAISAIFPTALAHFMSVSHSGNSLNTPNVSIIIIFLMVICDIWYYYCKDSDGGYHFLSNKVFFELKYVHCFLDIMQLQHLTDYSTV